MRDAQALVVGEALIDRVAGSAGSGYPGGSAANVAVSLGRLGRRVRLLTQLGDDADAELIMSWLGESGVGLAEGTRRAGQTSTAIARLSPDVETSYAFDLSWRLDGSPAIPEDTVVVHTGSIAAMLEPGAQVVERLVRRARRSATITYDPNVRPSLMGEPDPVRRQVERMVGLADVVKVSDADLGWLVPGTDPVAVGQAWLRLGPSLVVITLGGEGAVAVSRQGETRVEAPTVPVVDTIGAGDSFMGALIDGLWSARLLAAGQRYQLREIGPDRAAALLRQCTEAAAVTVSRAGADPPYRHELSRRI
jgi:fructokinase